MSILLRYIYFDPVFFFHHVRILHNHFILRFIKKIEYFMRLKITVYQRNIHNHFFYSTL